MDSLTSVGNIEDIDPTNLVARFTQALIVVRLPLKPAGSPDEHSSQRWVCHAPRHRSTFSLEWYCFMGGSFQTIQKETSNKIRLKGMVKGLFGRNI